MELEPALIPSITFSDGVLREQGTNKLTLIGTFHQFTLPQFPFQPPPFFVTICLVNLRGRLEHFKLALRIEDKSSGHVVASAGGEVGTTTELKATDALQLPFQLTGTFPSAGLYSVVVLVQNDPIGSRDLPVISLSNVANPPLT